MRQNEHMVGQQLPTGTIILMLMPITFGKDISMTSTDPKDSGYYINQPRLAGLVSRMSMKARQKMFDRLMLDVRPTSSARVLDVGVTSNRRKESNFFERLYPYPSQITAVGLEDAYFLEDDHPGLTYVMADGLNLPFPDQSFDLVVSFAVIEHAGSRFQQKAFLKELCRVGKSIYLTTPNRWFPVEFHTVMPLVHWLPPEWFRFILKLLGKRFYAQEENLNLLTAKDLMELFPPAYRCTSSHHRLFGLISNLVVHAQKLSS